MKANKNIQYKKHPLEIICWCGKRYSVAEVVEFAGKQFECPNCQMVHEVPNLPANGGTQ